MNYLIAAALTAGALYLGLCVLWVRTGGVRWPLDTAYRHAMLIDLAALAVFMAVMIGAAWLIVRRAP